MSQTNNALDFPAKSGALAIAGLVANETAAKNVFLDYQQRKSANTLRRQAADLHLFSQFLAEAGVPSGDFMDEPLAWKGVTWGLVEGFIRWQLLKGYAVGTVNVRLATIKSYAKLALKAGAISPEEYALITTVKGYSQKDKRHINEQRKENEISIRIGSKKKEPVTISIEQANMLIQRKNSPQERRDSFLMAILLDHGLRVGEAVLLDVSNFNLDSGEFTFFRPKVDKIQTHKMTLRTLESAKRYFEHDAPKVGCIWRASASKSDGREMSGELTTQGMSERAITKRVMVLGKEVGLSGLSAHDCRHYWATNAARSGTPIDRLQEAGGWNSPAMPLRYVEASKIANDGVKLSEGN